MRKHSKRAALPIIALAARLQFSRPKMGFEENGPNDPAYDSKSVVASIGPVKFAGHRRERR